ncbi:MULTISPECIES: PspA/IM30 family protein [unclassified Coleofasciculus]|uniref:PspA/IM30 family protein n=1 Tax=unclassified Coleofasciculus TaxID=2692782 RepID=UPI00187FEF4C|nr:MULTISPECIES: PspA/IM30 family protein [unclassified Coleofasciculus]MBE9130152.1 PspA/IM30 family protein [Coleofasciculus sp. LEGE 07081]MBE9151267.1 PspA/IM30 family protein [Coleofasciculus sp. LEGE 07092]
MGLIDRIWRVIRANLNSLIGQAEDPEKILEQAVDEMQQNLIQMRQAVAQAIASQKRTERQASQSETTANEWYNRAQLALSKGDDTLAREALTRRKSYQETAKALTSQLTQQNEIVTKLKKDMRTLESKISEAKTKKDLYIARARSAQASQKINEMLGNMNTGSALSTFEKMEDKVLQLEAQSQAMAELSGNELDQRFATLESGGEIDAELAAMKASLSAGTESPKLPSNQATSAETMETDGELEKLRSELENS